VVIIALGSGEINFSKQYYNKTSIMGNYTTSIVDMEQVIESGKPITEAPVAEARSKVFNALAATIINFEKKLAAAMPDPEKASEIKYYYQPRTIAQVQEMIPQIDILEYLDAQAPDGYPITPNRTVIMGDMDFYKVLPGLIEEAGRETIHAYFRSRLLRSWAGRLHKDFTLPLRRLGNQLQGKDLDNLPERWRTCVSEVDRSVGHILGAQFIERAFTSKDKEFGDRIIKDIKDIFAERLHGFDWMTPEVKELAAKKGKTTLNYII